MNELNFDVDPISLSVVPAGARAKPKARFFRVMEKDKELSERDGRTIHKEVELIQIYIDEHNQPVHRVTDQLRNEYPQDYQRFVAKEPPKNISGTLLSEMFIMTRSRAEDYGSGGIYTVEQLAVLPDVRLRAFGAETEKDRESARGYLRRVEGGEAAIEALSRRKLELEKELEEALYEIEELKMIIKSLEVDKEEPKPKRTRRRKDVISNE